MAAAATPPTRSRCERVPGPPTYADAQTNTPLTHGEGGHASANAGLVEARLKLHALRRPIPSDVVRV
jgi:hypothetical protein